MVWIIVMFLSAVWTLILTAPIHCRASTDEQVIKSACEPAAISPCSPRPVNPLKLSRAELVSTWMGDLVGKLGYFWKRCQQGVLGLCGSQSPSTVTLYCQNHRPSDETLNRGPDSLWSLIIPNGQISPLASDHYGHLIIPKHWLASSLWLLSTSKLVCEACSGAIWLPSHHPGGCCTLVVVEEPPPPM